MCDIDNHRVKKKKWFLHSGKNCHGDSLPRIWIMMCRCSNERSRLFHSRCTCFLAGWDLSRIKDQGYSCLVFLRETFTWPGGKKERPDSSSYRPWSLSNNYLYLARSLSLSLLGAIVEAAHLVSLSLSGTSIRSCLSLVGKQPAENPPTTPRNVDGRRIIANTRCIRKRNLIFHSMKG